MIIREAPIRQGHSAVQGILNAVRQIWLVNGRVAVKSVIRKCVICYRMQARTLQYAIAQLPTNRDKFEQPFLVVSTDYCRPFYNKAFLHISSLGAENSYIFIVTTLQHLLGQTTNYK